MAANDIYDVFQMGNNFLTYQSVLYPLNEYIESGVIDMSDANELFLSSGTLDGQVLGIPLGVNAVCLVYDPEMFEAAGVPEPTINWTWDDYMRSWGFIIAALRILSGRDLRHMCLSMERM